MTRTLEPEDRISRYRIVGPLGAGGMGEVYRAHDASLGRDVALKILPRHLVRNEERLRRFVLEAKSASSLNHPNIITIYEIGEDQVRSGEGAGDGNSDSTPSPIHFISMELITGETLATKIHQEKTDLKTLSSWLAQAAEGLAKAHAAGIVHRDLKPGNIMISTDGYAKVLDFGLAKLAEKQGTDNDLTSAPTEARDQTAEGVVLGTTGYMSPEQVQGRPADHRSDIFSFGCVLYEAATRHRPFDAETGAERMAKILREKPSPIEELNPEVPAELRRLIRRCLAKNPDQRLDSMRALALELREIVEEYEALSASASSGGTGALAAPRTGRTWLMTGVAAVALLGLAGIAFGIYQFVRNRGSGPAGETVSESLEMTSLMSRPLINSIALSRGSRYLAYVTGPAGRWSLWVRQVATGSEVPILTAQKSSPLGLAFSPDENYLYYHMQDPGTPNLTVRLLFEVPALGGSPQKRAVNVASAVSFAPDGKRVCFQRRIPQKNESTLVILDLQSGTERTLATLKAPQSFAGAPSWSPDGKNIASGVSNPAEGGQGGHVIALEVEGGGQTEIGSAPWLFVNSIAWLPDGSGLVIAASHQSTLGQPALWMLTYPEGRAHKITNDLNTYSGVNVSGDGASIASIRSARFSNLWAVPSDGSGRPRQLTNTSGSQDSVLAIAATGNSGVVFQAWDGRYSRLWRIGLDGSGRRPLTSGPTHSFLPEGIPGGGMVFMQAGEDLVWHLWAMGADGSDPRRLTHGAGEVIPVVSPDGKTLLYRRADLARELWAIPLAGGEPRRIVTQSDAYGRFSRDGKWIAYGSWVEVDGKVTGRWRIVPASGGEPIASFSMRPGSSSVDWAPDGSAITFPAEEEGVFQIFRQPIGGGDPKPITRFTEGLIKSHAWSPDGRRIGLTRTIADVDNLWSVAADGSNPVRLTDFEEGNVFVANATEDGKQILFVFGRESKDVVLIRNFR